MLYLLLLLYTVTSTEVYSNTFRLHRWMSEIYISSSSARKFHVYKKSVHLSRGPFLGKVLTCLTTCKKEENLRDRYTVAVCKVDGTVGQSSQWKSNFKKNYGKSFAVANISAKTAKVFHSKTFALYDIALTKIPFMLHFCYESRNCFTTFVLDLLK